MVEFLDKMKKGFEKGVRTVSVKSKEKLDVVKVKGEIGTLLSKKRESVEELGNIVYTMFLNGEFDEERVRSKCEAIRDLDSRVDDKQEELKQIQLSAKQALGQAVVVANCECGAELTEGAKFCGKCGRQV